MAMMIAAAAAVVAVTVSDLGLCVPICKSACCPKIFIL
jgi:hypothetical protein